MSRKITEKMFHRIDQALANNALAQDAIADKDARRLLVLAAGTCVGIREHGGNNRGEWVEEMQKTCSRPVAQSWCMDAVQTLIAYVEEKLGLKSPLVTSEGCAFVWAHSPVEQRVKFMPLPGAIVIYHHPKGGGHTGIIEATDGETMHCFEGNTEGGLDSHDKVVRDGGGYYHTKRLFHGTPDMKVVGFLKPF